MSNNEWVVDFGYTHHIAKDTSLFSSLDIVVEKKIYMADDFSLDITIHGDLPGQHHHIVDVYHVPSLFNFPSDTNWLDF